MSPTFIHSKKSAVDGTFQVGIPRSQVGEASYAALREDGVDFGKGVLVRCSSS